MLTAAHAAPADHTECGKPQKSFAVEVQAIGNTVCTHACHLKRLQLTCLIPTKSMYWMFMPRMTLALQVAPRLMA